MVFPKVLFLTPTNRPCLCASLQSTSILTTTRLFVSLDNIETWQQATNMPMYTPMVQVMEA
jgi:hypothetical protein